MDIRDGHIARLGPRIPLVGSNIIGRMESIINIAVPNRVVERQSAATSSCTSGDNSSACEKPVGSSTFTLPIVLGVA